MFLSFVSFFYLSFHFRMATNRKLGAQWQSIGTSCSSNQIPMDIHIDMQESLSKIQFHIYTATHS